MLDESYNIETKALDPSSIKKTITNNVKKSTDLNSVVLTGSAEETGWYYDNQLNNDLTSVKLMANTEIEEKDGEKTWKMLSDNGDYPKEVVRSIISEDFNIDIQNNWNDYGEDFIGHAITMAVKPMAVYGRAVIEGLQNIQKNHNSRMAGTSSDDLSYQDSMKNTITGRIINNILESKTLDHLIERKDKLSEIFNGALVTQGCSFTTYTGTGVSFNNLGMQFTLFPSWDSNGNFISVNDKINSILPYAIGDLKDISSTMKPIIKGAVEGTIGLFSELTNTNAIGLYDNLAKTPTAQNLAESIDTYVKWQEPPAGYLVNSPMNLDVNGFKGTLRLDIGSHYSIKSLVINNMSLRFSKQMVKNPKYFEINHKNQSDMSIGLSPLFCDVNILLRPITKYSINSLREFISGNSNNRSNTVRRMVNTLETSKNLISPKSTTPLV